jgi:hypothetical protein
MTISRLIFTIPQPYRTIFSQQEKIWRIGLSRSIKTINYISHQIFLAHKNKKKTYKLSTLVPVYRGQIALLVANGPSVKKLNITMLRDLQLNDRIIVFGVNYSPLLFENKLREQVGLDFLVLSDHYINPRNKSEVNQKFWKIVFEDEIKIITPSDWCDPETFPLCMTGSCFHFNDFGTEGIFKHIDPTKTRNYISLTSFKALAICKYLEFKRIYLVGLDNNFFNGMSVDHRLNLIENAHHATSMQHFESNVSKYWPMGLGDYFYFVSKMFVDLRTYFSYENIINLDSNSLNDVHKKIQPTDELYALLIRELE